MNKCQDSKKKWNSIGSNGRCESRRIYSNLQTGQCVIFDVPRPVVRLRKKRRCKPTFLSDLLNDTLWARTTHPNNIYGRIQCFHYSYRGQSIHWGIRWKDRIDIDAHDVVAASFLNPFWEIRRTRAASRKRETPDLERTTSAAFLLAAVFACALASDAMGRERRKVQFIFLSFSLIPQ